MGKTPKELSKKNRQALDTTLTILNKLCVRKRLAVKTPNGIGLAEKAELLFTSEGEPGGFLLYVTKYTVKGEFN